jgi:4'-phosphopantetheinyl transferase
LSRNKLSFPFCKLVRWAGFPLTFPSVRRETLVYAMSLQPLHLWYAYPDDLLDPGVAQACAGWLTPEERARWQRYKFEQRRRESLATRALVRSALTHLRAVPPEAWRFKENEHGKPFLDPDCGLRFNLSNAVGLVVCLVAEGIEVGVDVESPTRAGQIMDVAERVFSVEERAQLQGLEGAARLDRALSLWTLKEAYIKARGLGLALPLVKISFLFEGAENIRLKIDPDVDENPDRWKFCSFDLSGHRVGVVVELETNPAMNLWEARPLLAALVARGRCGATWFPRT